MLKDLRDLPQDITIDADLCIIGAGAAGITLARRLRGHGHRICLIESGGFEESQPVQDLYKGRLAGLPYVDLDMARLRFFGGTTNHWEGMCVPLMAMDFDRRSAVPLSGWPISYTDVARYYVEAQEACQLGPLRYDLSDWLAAKWRLPELNRVHSRVFQYGPPVRFGTAYRQELVDADDVTILLHANVTEIMVDDSGEAVGGLRLATLDGKTATARASRYVLACGGIENPRLLLSSDQVHTAGIGNGHDQVGRYFMEHYEVWPADMVMTAAKERVQPYFGFNVDGLYLKPCMVLDPEVQDELGIANGGAILDSAAYRDDVTGFVALRRLLNGVRAGNLNEAWETLPLVLTNLDDVAQGTWRKLHGQRYRPLADERQNVKVKIYGEQVPNPDSRVTLGDDRDALGMRRPVLDWRLTDLDRRSAITSARVIGEGLAAEGAGRMRMAEWVEDEGWPATLEGGMHHMGTTRMSADPRHGVVDGDCRVHGMRNLYIAGSSVFPTCGYANPTLSIVAMTLRLADHLSTRMAQIMPTARAGED